ncbi:MAG: hypothetical protein LQ351_000382 [Letrouitia transgressa]|nr:MAG: hypothetical protein LQ351_000382 [Letrouitia transgressa]
MPSLSDQPPNPQLRPSSINPYYQEESLRGRSGNQRLETKHDRNTENANKERSSNAYPQELASPLLSRLQASSNSPPPRANPVSAPFLAALGTFQALDDTRNSVHPTTEWAQNIPYGRSPPDRQENAFTAGATPPDLRQPSQESRGGFSHASPPSSPQNRYSKPVRQSSGYQPLTNYLGSSPGRERPVSVHSQRPQSQYRPPLPHHPQAHFYGTPELDLNLHHIQDDSQRSDERSCYRFDSLGSAGVETFKGTNDVLLVGRGSSLHIYGIGKSRCEHIGCLENLRGRVTGAKILPSSARDDPLHSLRPLVAVIIHGFREPETLDNPHQDFHHADDALFEPTGSMLQALQTSEPISSTSGLNYQTTVEVYSLQRGDHVATLLRSPGVHVEAHQSTQRVGAPPTEGDLRLEACGRFLAVGLGRSGEVFIFENRAERTSETGSMFKCIGKTWTSVTSRKPRSYSASSNESEHSHSPDTSTVFLGGSQGAIFSLSHRWLAVAPPGLTNRSTMHWIVEADNTNPKPPGLTSHTSPSAPQPNCDLDTPDAESVLNKVARDLTQELMKGARWMGDQGLQAWRTYWSKPVESSPQTGSRSLPDNPHVAHSQHNPFPPTHANEPVPSRVSHHGVNVSILDLERLSENQASKESVAFQLVANFALPQGCSLLSFTPGGLGLLTASAKGDVQHVWSLLRMVHGNGLALQGDQTLPDKGPNVRQMARYTRMTIARIIDVVWMEPFGEKLALVTERGTVHIYDLPPSALQWPPPRRTVTSMSTRDAVPKPPDPNGSGRPSSTQRRLSSAVDMVTGKTQPFLAAVRGRTPSSGISFSGISGASLTAGAGVKSGKAVAAGFNKSIGAATGTVNTFRHMGENRLTLPESSHATSGCVKWLGGNECALLAVTDGSIVRIHGIRESTNQRAGKRRSSVVGGKQVEFDVMHVLERPVEANSSSNAVESLGSTKNHSPKGFWLGTPFGSRKSTGKEAGLSHAEIETNAPYQPFHTDRRVSYFVYEEDHDFSQDERLNQPTPWVFGEPLVTQQTASGSAALDDEDESDPYFSGPIENHIRIQGNEEDGQQVVVSTRRRRLKGTQDTGSNDVEEFFEDDLEVVDFADERV